MSTEPRSPSRLKRILLVGAIVCGWIIVCDLAAIFVLGETIDTVGVRGMMMLTRPRDAYLIAYGPRTLDWRGIHIGVDSQFVLVARGNALAVRRVVFMPPMLGLGVTFMDMPDSARGKFARRLESCERKPDQCAVHRFHPSAGQSVCLEYFDRRARGTGEDIEVWNCRLPTGIEARYTGSLPECAQYDAIVRNAFATARVVDARTGSGARSH